MTPAQSKRLVQVKKLYEDVELPARGSQKAAGYDLHAYITDEDRNIVGINGKNAISIPPHTTKMIRTGLSITPPEDCFGGIYARSGLSIKQGLRPANCVGVCDEDYTGEYIVALMNDSNVTRTVEHGQRIAQVIFAPYLNVDFEVVDNLTVTERGDGRCGSTGV